MGSWPEHPDRQAPETQPAPSLPTPNTDTWHPGQAKGRTTCLLSLLEASCQPHDPPTAWFGERGCTFGGEYEGISVGVPESPGNILLNLSARSGGWSGANIKGRAAIPSSGAAGGRQGQVSTRLGLPVPPPAPFRTCSCSGCLEFRALCKPKGAGHGGSLL